MHLCFDLDGTLTDSFPGISRCINHALVAIGRDAVPESSFRGLVGAPLTTIFAELCSSSDRVLLDRAVAAYRERFNTIGMFENSVFADIPEALIDFRAHGHVLRVVTAKPAVSAGRVLEHFGLDRFFDAIHGPDLADRSCNKADLVAAALMTASEPADAVMIGDRVDDIAAARANRIRAVGVAWGYGSQAELVDAGADYIAETVADLRAWVHRSAVGLRAG
jgi:phosphoglycolate phosphatase